MHLRFLIEYDGTDYHGWQFQNNCVSVQEKFEEAIRIVTKQQQRVRAAGRTDAGVHALGQVVDVHLDGIFDPQVILRSLNGVLPRDIAVIKVEEAPEKFVPQTWVRHKTYRYVILNRKTRCAVGRRYVWHYPWPLDLGAIREAASIIEGEHDFSAFRASTCNSTKPIQLVSVCKVVDKPDGYLVLEVTAGGFLKHMVRIIAGTLITVGHGTLLPQQVQDILDSGDRTQAGETLPAHGLCLIHLRYDDGFGDRPGLDLEHFRPSF